MNKELRELLNSIENKHAEATNFINEGRFEEATKLLDETDTLTRIYNQKQATFTQNSTSIEESGVVIKNSNKKNQVGEFLNAVRGKKFDNSMVSGDNRQGGYTVPEDIRTRVQRLLEEQDSLVNFVRTSRVNTESGERTFLRRNSGYIHKADTVAELAQITEAQTPQFGRIDYKVYKFMNFYVASTEVLEDSDEELSGILVDWIVDVSRVTRNNIVRVVLQSQTAEDAFGKTIQRANFQSTNDIKKAFNVGLDKAFWNRSIFITNQDGFNLLDTLQYPDGRYVLQEDPTDRTRHIFLGRRLEVVSNNDLPTEGQNAPLVVGDLTEGVELFDRRLLTIRRSDEAGQAWRTDSVEWRSRERFDCQLRDAEAFIYGTINIETGLTVTPQVNSVLSARQEKEGQVAHAKYMAEIIKQVIAEERARIEQESTEEKKSE